MRKTVTFVKPYTRRIVRKFLFFPMTVTYREVDNTFDEEYTAGIETRWLEWATWEETYYVSFDHKRPDGWRRTSGFIDK